MNPATRHSPGSADLQRRGDFDVRPSPERGTTVSTRTALLDGESVGYTLRRSRRRTIGLQIDERGLVVAVPRDCSQGELEAVLQRKARWIRTHLERWHERERQRRRLADCWHDGGPLRHLGDTLRMRIHPGSDILRRNGPTLEVGLPATAGIQALRTRVHAWLQAEARRVFGERLPIFCDRLGRAPASWCLSSARTRWGSCTAGGVIRLNWRLIHFPPDVIDYVIAHELAHLEELNHSPAFWAVVDRLMPDWRDARQRLRDLHAEGVALQE